MRLTALAALVAALAALPAPAREAIEECLGGNTPFAVIRRTIRLADCEEGLRYLASDELQGRDTGSKGHAAAAKWVAEQFEKSSLEPVGDDQTYFQNWKWGKRGTMNVVGFLPGKTDEVVVVGAHLDHVGMGAPNPFSGRMHNRKAGDDQIFNGADDNASGSTAVVEMARALAALGTKPRRGILFILFSGEEKGLLGAAHYVKNPIFPLEKTAAMFNLDMVGRNKDGECMVLGADCSPELKDALDRANAQAGLKLAVKTTGIFAASDQWVFYQKKVPVLFFTTGGHPEYHTELDHADLINFGKVEAIAELVSLIALDVAGAKEKPSFQEIKGLAGMMGGGKPKLGVTPAGLDADQADELGLGPKEGGVLLNDVMEGLPAKKAGLRPGDVVVKWEGKTLPRDGALFDFRSRIQRAKPGSTVEIEVIRDGKRKKVKVTFEMEEKEESK
ncbi:MAG: M20/M25/M40 family metallo-hydrolase [Planctomycetes bacterium]|nr:M20/M25/M40 family metallo-hydrolase [Planctomycetota bacterium]